MIVYVSITNFCNMACGHCCYSSGPDNVGQMMSVEDFEKALRLFPLNYLNIGGGEPTTHPRFWDIMAIALALRPPANGRPKIWIATNGKITSSAMKLANLCENGQIRSCLSLDQWHDPIDKTVIGRYCDLSKFYKGAIRNVALGDGPIKNGRWQDDRRVVCNCHPGPHIKWHGAINQCGCTDSPIISTIQEASSSQIILDRLRYFDWNKCGLGRPHVDTPCTPQPDVTPLHRPAPEEIDLSKEEMLVGAP